MHKLNRIIFSLMVLVLAGCAKSQTVISGVDEREANLIVVFLDSKGIKAIKAKQASGGIGAQNKETLYDIQVEQNRVIESMAILNQNGLPRQRGTNLLDLFAKQGLMTTDKEEQIRYQAGLEQQIANTILMIDGVIDATVQLSFPPTDVTTTEQKNEHVTAAVYVKHQGVVDDPNAHLDTKIKRLVSGSVNGLSVDDVTVVSDRSRFTDITVADLNQQPANQGYVKIWGIVMSQESAATFRLIFFTVLILGTVFAALFGWLMWKFYPTLKKMGGLSEMFKSKPVMATKDEGEPAQGTAPEEHEQPEEGHGYPPQQPPPME